MVLALAAVAATGCASIAGPKGWASPVLVDGLLLVAHRDELFALDPEDLSPRWRFPASGQDVDPGALYGAPAMLNGIVFVPTYEGNLYAIAADSGEPEWGPFEADGPLVGDATASDGTVYFGSSDGKVYALDAESGEPRWNPFATGKEVWSPPVLHAGTLFVTSFDRRLYALDAETGRELWSFSTGAGIGSPAVVVEEEGVVLVAGFDTRLRAIDLETHEERWSVKAGNWFWAEPHLNDGVVYAGSLDGRVHAVDVATGERKWPKAFSTGSAVRSAAAVVGEDLLVIDRDGRVYRIDRATGEAKSQVPLELGDDVLADPLVVAGAGPGETTVLVVTTGGELVRIDPGTLTVVARQRLTGE